MGRRGNAVLVMMCSLSAACGFTKTEPKGVPGRIVTLTPSCTELVVALAATDRLVGRDKYSLEPAAVLALPVVGDFLSANAAAILALKPDLVLLDQSQTKVRDSLAALDVPTRALAMHQLSDVRKGLLEVGKALGKSERASALVEILDATIAEHAQRGAKRTDRARVLLIVDRSPDGLRNLIAAGPKTYLDELLNLVGAVNVMSGSAVRYPHLSAEQIMRVGPDVIIDLSKAPGGTEAYQSVAEVPAVVHGRVHIVDDRHLLGPTPRVGEALEHMARLTELR